MKPHDSTLVPLLGRGVFTAGFAPARPFPTPTYKCVGGSRSRKSRLVARRRLASCSSLCQEVMNVSAPCNTPLCHGALSSIFAARVHTALSTPNVSRLSTVEPSVAPNAWKSSLRQSIQFCSGRPCLDLPPRLVFRPSAASGGARRVSGHGSREEKSPLSNGSFHALAPSLLEGLSVRKLSVGAALAAVPDNSQE